MSRKVSIRLMREPENTPHIAESARQTGGAIALVGMRRSPGYDLVSGSA
jgi:hypothetical protein